MYISSEQLESSIAEILNAEIIDYSFGEFKEFMSDKKYTFPSEKMIEIMNRMIKIKENNSLYYNNKLNAFEIILDGENLIKQDKSGFNSFKNIKAMNKYNFLNLNNFNNVENLLIEITKCEPSLLKQNIKHLASILTAIFQALNKRKVEIVNHKLADTILTLLAKNIDSNLYNMKLFINLLHCKPLSLVFLSFLIKIIFMIFFIIVGIFFQIY